MNKNKLVRQIRASTKNIKCDLVIKNITIIDVFNQNRFIDSVGIKDGYIVGIGNYDGVKIIDGKNKFICPSLIDAHCHIESSLVTPNEYHKAALLNGITSVIADPHEIANVLGSKGIKYMLDASSSLVFDMYFMLPSCVPGTDFENSGATLLAEDLKNFYKHDRILGLAEVMNFPAVFNAEESMIDKIYDAISNNKIIDGHGAGLSPLMVNTYRTANILTDHECVNPQEALEKIRRGMHILIREGTVAKNLKELLPVVTEANSSRFCFCTDDKHIDDLIENGSINSSIRYAIKHNLKPETAIQMATLNPAILYKLNNKGAIAPGYIADFLILDDLENFKINSVYKNGQLVVSGNTFIENEQTPLKQLSIPNSVNLPNLSLNDFNISLRDKSTLNVIDIIPNKLESNLLKIDINKEIIDETTLNFKSSINTDLLKISVIERHTASGNIGLGILKGLGLKEGAIGTTIAHDSHNLILAGTNDMDMLLAAKELEKMGGGIIVVNKGKILASIQLEIGGLMTNRTFKEIKYDLERLHNAIKLIAPYITFNPFLTLSFLSLPVIPQVKITDKGLFDVTKFEFIPTAE